ncbi:hypothetical protein ACOYW6_04485 [Parablastomonas sp. CN1-191]|uniref:hypothetical protein n=1 Tax=Parablastomonas sp. CN1-191 TaxID=3400908 RepID=UPI003BF7C467
MDRGILHLAAHQHWRHPGIGPDHAAIAIGGEIESTHRDANGDAALVVERQARSVTAHRTAFARLAVSLDPADDRTDTFWRRRRAGRGVLRFVCRRQGRRLRAAAREGEKVPRQAPRKLGPGRLGKVRAGKRGHGQNGRFRRQGLYHPR